MFEFSGSKNEIVIKKKPIFLGIGFVFLAFAAIGIKLVLSSLPSEEGGTFWDILPYAFICVWILVALSMSVVSFATYSKQVTINNDGVLCKSWFNKDFIKWSDIKDWGLSYCGQTRGEGNTYYLYFSRHECLGKNECRKKLKGKMIKVFVFGNGYDDAVSGILPFCREKTGVAPFVAKDKFHFM